jgi:hypothetical protein
MKSRYLTLTGLIVAWNRTWFPETSAVRLAACRIIVVGATLLFFTSSLEQHLHLIKFNEAFIQPQTIIVALAHILTMDFLRSTAFFVLLYWVTIISGVTTLVGFWTRTSALLFSLGNLILVAHAYSYGTRHHPDAALAIFLLLLAFSPSGLCLSVDSYCKRLKGRNKHPTNASGVTAQVDNAYWPLLLTQILLSLIYLSAGLCKLRVGGLHWLNGYTLQTCLLQDAVRFQNSYGFWLAQQHELSIALSLIIVIFECFFFLTVIWKTVRPFILLAGVGLHIGIFMTMSAPFFQLLVLYAVFIDFDCIAKYLTLLLAQGAILNRSYSPIHFSRNHR